MTQHSIYKIHNFIISVHANRSTFLSLGLHVDKQESYSIILINDIELLFVVYQLSIFLDKIDLLFGWDGVLLYVIVKCFFATSKN